MLDDRVCTVGSCTVSCGGPVGFGGAGSLKVSPATLLSILYRVGAGWPGFVEAGLDTGGVAPLTQYGFGGGAWMPTAESACMLCWRLCGCCCCTGCWTGWPGP